MPPQTYLPTGMEGIITCPAASQPPLLHVDWTKDGEPLNLSMVLKTLCSPFSACRQFGQSLFKFKQSEDQAISKVADGTFQTKLSPVFLSLSFFKIADSSFIGFFDPLLHFFHNITIGETESENTGIPFNVLLLCGLQSFSFSES